MKIKARLDTGDTAVIVLDDVDTIEKAAEYLSSINIKWVKTADGRIVFTRNISAIWDTK